MIWWEGKLLLVGCWFFRISCVTLARHPYNTSSFLLRHRMLETWPCKRTVCGHGLSGSEDEDLFKPKKFSLQKWLDIGGDCSRWSHCNFVSRAVKRLGNRRLPAGQPSRSLLRPKAAAKWEFPWILLFMVMERERVWAVELKFRFRSTV